MKSTALKLFRALDQTDFCVIIATTMVKIRYKCFVLFCVTNLKKCGEEAQVSFFRFVKFTISRRQCNHGNSTVKVDMCNEMYYCVQLH
jgi:hypothetical protein